MVDGTPEELQHLLEPTEVWLEYFDEKPSYAKDWPWKKPKDSLGTGDTSITAAGLPV